MAELRLRTFDDSSETDSIPFPRGVAFGRAEEPRERADERPIDSAELAAKIEASLDQLQRRLDRVKDELEGVYRFPGPDDWKPTAA